MTGQLAYFRRAFRALLTLLLFTASVTPAIAEIGCARASLTHEAVRTGVPTPVVCACDTTPSDQQGAPGETGHCAFAHGEHGLDTPFAVRVSGSTGALRAPFHDRAPVFLTAAPRDGPERPPQA